MNLTKKIFLGIVGMILRKIMSPKAATFTTSVIRMGVNHSKPNRPATSYR